MTDWLSEFDEMFANETIAHYGDDPVPLKNCKELYNAIKQFFSRAIAEARKEGERRYYEKQMNDKRIEELREHSTCCFIHPNKCDYILDLLTALDEKEKQIEYLLTALDEKEKQIAEMKNPVLRKMQGDYIRGCSVRPKTGRRA